MVVLGSRAQRDSTTAGGGRVVRSPVAATRASDPAEGSDAPQHQGPERKPGRAARGLDNRKGTKMASPAIDLAVEATPIVATLPLEALYVDRRFQRPLNERRAAKIAAEFDPSLLGVLHVNARRKGGAAAYSVLDGQHRLLELGGDLVERHDLPVLGAGEDAERLAGLRVDA